MKRFLFFAFLFSGILFSSNIISRNVEGDLERSVEPEHGKTIHPDDDHDKDKKDDSKTKIEKEKEYAIREIEDLMKGGKKHKLSSKKKSQLNKIKKEIKKLKDKYYKKAKKKINKLKEDAIRIIRSGGDDASNGRIDFEVNKRVYQQKLEDLMRAPAAMKNKLLAMNLQNLATQFNGVTQKTFPEIMDEIDSLEQQIKTYQHRCQ
jgi:archaellum component FlaC